MFANDVDNPTSDTMFANVVYNPTSHTMFGNVADNPVMLQTISFLIPCMLGNEPDNPQPHV